MSKLKDLMDSDEGQILQAFLMLVVVCSILFVVMYLTVGKPKDNGSLVCSGEESYTQVSVDSYYTQRGGNISIRTADGKYITYWPKPGQTCRLVDSK